MVLKTKSTAPAPVGVRLPDDLKTWLKYQAQNNRRSMNGEILVRLEQSRLQQQTQGAQA